MKLWPIAVLCAFAMLAACGQPSSSTATGSSTNLPGTPQSATPASQFLTAAAMYENYQMQAAEIAQAQSHTDAVKTYAANAAAMYRAELQGLMNAARASGMTAPVGELNEDYRGYIDLLRNESATPFDNRYAAQQALLTMSMAGRFDSYTSTAPDSPLKQWAMSQSQAVHDQINAARQMAAATR